MKKTSRHTAAELLRDLPEMVLDESTLDRLEEIVKDRARRSGNIDGLNTEEDNPRLGKPPDSR